MRGGGRSRAFEDEEAKDVEAQKEEDIAKPHSFKDIHGQSRTPGSVASSRSRGRSVSRNSVSIKFHTDEVLGAMMVLEAAHQNSLHDVKLRMHDFLEGSEGRRYARSILLAKRAVEESLPMVMEALLDDAEGPPLLKADAVLDTGSRMTLLHFAAEAGETEIVKLLIDKGAWLGARDINNCTALHYAAENHHKEICLLLIKARAPLYIMNFSNERPVRILPKVMRHRDFKRAVTEAYGSMIALGLEFVLSSTMVEKLATVKADIIKATCELYLVIPTPYMRGRRLLSADEMNPGSLGSSGKGGMPHPAFGAYDDGCSMRLGFTLDRKTKLGEGVPGVFSDGGSALFDDRYVEEYLQRKDSGDRLLHERDHMSQLVQRDGTVQHLELASFTARYPFDRVFSAASRHDLKEGVALEEENDGMADTHSFFGIPNVCFIWMAVSPTELSNVYNMYRHATVPDIIGMFGLFLMCLVFAIGGAFISGAIVVTAVFKASIWMTRNLFSSCGKCRATSKCMRSKEEDRPKLPGSSEIAAGSGRAKILVHWVDDPMGVSDFHSWRSTVWGVALSHWESFKGRRKERHTHVHVKKVDILHAAKAYPDGLLAVLADYDVDSTVYETEAVRAVVEYKWRTFARGVLKTECTLQFVALILLTILAIIIHDPDNQAYHDFRPFFLGGRLAGLTRFVAFGIAVMILRVLIYDLAYLYSTGNLWYWLMSFWSWVDIISISCYFGATAGQVNNPDPQLMSGYISLLCLAQWVKLLYFARGFKPFAGVVGMCLATLHHIRYFLVLLGCILMAFGTSFYVLFRIEANEDNAPGYKKASSIYLQILSLLIGNLDPKDFEDVHHVILGVIIATFCVVVCPIVMLNLLISIVSGVWEESTNKAEANFIKSKAQIVSEIESCFPFDRRDKLLFPDDIYLMHPVSKKAEGGSESLTTTASYVGVGGRADSPTDAPPPPPRYLGLRRLNSMSGERPPMRIESPVLTESASSTDMGESAKADDVKLEGLGDSKSSAMVENLSEMIQSQRQEISSLKTEMSSLQEKLGALLELNHGLLKELRREQQS